MSCKLVHPIKTHRVFTSNKVHFDNPVVSVTPPCAFDPSSSIISAAAGSLLWLPVGCAVSFLSVFPLSPPICTSSRFSVASPFCVSLFA